MFDQKNQLLNSSQLYQVIIDIETFRKQSGDQGNSKVAPKALYSFSFNVRYLHSQAAATDIIV